MERERIRSICRLVVDDSRNVASRLAAAENVSRQTASAWLAQAKQEGWLVSEGVGRGVGYALAEIGQAQESFQREGLSEDDVWRKVCAPVVRSLPDNVRGIWHHGMTEMINNAVDHSGSASVTVAMRTNALYSEAIVSDAGEGIFLKIQRALALYDTREAILELAKGKFTTDPKNHSGEGIFFSSKMFDVFRIHSGKLHFDHSNGEPDVLIKEDVAVDGTLIYMQLDNDSIRTTREIFDRFALPDEFSFARTIVPVRLAQHEGETLVSRSQAKRLTRRFERFQSVVLDFTGVEEIGQAFADEVFRVFQNSHPEIRMTPVRTNQAIAAMIKRVQSPT